LNFLSIDASASFAVAFDIFKASAAGAVTEAVAFEDLFFIVWGFEDRVSPSSLDLYNGRVFST
jgi:hypothetical protein